MESEAETKPRSTKGRKKEIQIELNFEKKITGQKTRIRIKIRVGRKKCARNICFVKYKRRINADFSNQCSWKEKSNIKGFVLYHVKHTVSWYVVSLLLFETWVQVLWLIVLGVFFVMLKKSFRCFFHKLVVSCFCRWDYQVPRNRRAGDGTQASSLKNTDGTRTGKGIRTRTEKGIWRRQKKSTAKILPFYY